MLSPAVPGALVTRGVSGRKVVAGEQWSWTSAQGAQTSLDRTANEQGHGGGVLSSVWGQGGLSSLGVL